MAANNPHMLMASVGLYSEARRVRPNNNRPNEPIGFASHSCNLYIPWRSRTEYSDKYIRKLHISTYDMTIACRILQICIYIYIYLHDIYIYTQAHINSICIDMYRYVTCTRTFKYILNIIFLFTVHQYLIQCFNRGMPTSWGIGFYTLMISLETLKKWSRAGPGVGREVVVETTSKNVGKKIVIDSAESLRSSSVQPGFKPNKLSSLSSPFACAHMVVAIQSEASCPPECLQLCCCSIPDFLKHFS